MAQPQPRQMVLNRNFTLDSTLGHSIRFEKDKPVNVPRILYGQALGIGATFIDGEPAVVEQAAGPVEITDPIDRAAALLKIVTGIFERNNGIEFTAGGKPKSAVVSQEFGFEVTTSEVNKIVQAYYDAKAAEVTNA